MRLPVVEDQHRLPARLFIAVAQRLTGHPVDPVVVALTHRPERWGRWFAPIIARSMRGPSYWSALERERMAVAVSTTNECPFCVRTHTEVARVAGRRVAEQPAELRAELAATLVLLEKLTRDPDAVGPADMDAIRRAGTPDEAIEEALYVAFVFNCVNRVANALGFGFESDADMRFTARVLHRISYQLPGFVLR